MDEVVRVLRGQPPSVIAIGGSAGSLDALVRLLPELPAELPARVVVVVHLPPERDSRLVEALAGHCALPVCEAEDKMPTAPGCVYVAPPDYHVLLETDASLALSTDEPVNYSRPSIDVLFQSLADACGPRVLGILLSGANADGAAGLAAIHARGGLTWVQAPDSAAVPVMPEAALAMAAHTAMEPADMGRALAEWGRARG